MRCSCRPPCAAAHDLRGSRAASCSPMSGTVATPGDLPAVRFMAWPAGAAPTNPTDLPPTWSSMPSGRKLPWAGRTRWLQAWEARCNRRSQVMSDTVAIDRSTAPVNGLSTYLDTLTLLASSVGYGSVGRNGALGYEGKSVTVRGRRYARALSTHAPARLLFRLSGAYTTFRCQVGFNDDVRPDASHCDFIVAVDGKPACRPIRANAGAPPQELTADIAGAQVLELIVATDRWDHCHSVWLDPVV